MDYDDNTDAYNDEQLATFKNTVAKSVQQEIWNHPHPPSSNRFNALARSMAILRERQAAEARQSQRDQDAEIKQESPRVIRLETDGELIDLLFEGLDIEDDSGGFQTGDTDKGVSMLETGSPSRLSTVIEEDDDLSTPTHAQQPVLGPSPSLPAPINTPASVSPTRRGPGRPPKKQRNRPENQKVLKKVNPRPTQVQSKNTKF